MSYAEQLLEPHPLLLKPDQIARPLLSEVRDSLLQAPDEPVAQVELVQQHVRRTLRRPTPDVKIRGSYRDIMETMVAEQITNCLGYTAVTSECLDEAGIPNLVAYANGHAFNVTVMGGSKGARLRLTDSFDTSLDQDIDPALQHMPSGGVDQLLGGRVARIVAMLDSTVIAAGKGSTVESLQNNHPWLKGLKKDRILWRDTSGSDERYKYLRDNQVVISLFSPNAGRAMLTDYAIFKSAALRDDISTASAALQRLEGVYPDIEARSSHEYIKRVVRSLAGAGQAAEANTMVELYCSNFVGQDARLLSLEGDLYRVVARETHNSVAADRMVDAYTRARDVARYAKRAYSGKLGAATKLLMRMGA